jgi:hypothetical protein
VPSSSWATVDGGARVYGLAPARGGHLIPGAQFVAYVVGPAKVLHASLGSRPGCTASWVDPATGAARPAAPVAAAVAPVALAVPANSGDIALKIVC